MNWHEQAKRAIPVVLCFVLWAPSAVLAQEERTQSFDGRGSVGSDSSIEVYLLAAEYIHELSADGSCDITAGVFPAQREPAVRVSEVLQADLAVLKGRAVSRVAPQGVFSITQPGWATVQIGTGPDCAWSYEITGPFVPAGREPRPPGALAQPWVLWALTIAVGALLALPLVRRRQPSEASASDGERVTVLDAGAPGDGRL